MENIIEVKAIKKNYGKVAALNSVTLAIKSRGDLRAYADDDVLVF